MEMVLFIGIQGSGKSWFYKERFQGTHVRISRDVLRTAARERDLMQTCFRNAQSFILDNTNVKRQQRAEYIELAKTAGCRVIGYFFEATPREAIARNQRRSAKERVPIPGILRTYKQLQKPALSEGFEELYSVRLRPLPSPEGDCAVSVSRIESDDA
jgi:predicted kinase